MTIIREWQWVRECERWLAGTVAVVNERHPGEEIAKCEQCHRLLKIRYYRRLIVHLSVDHKLSENAAIETTNWIMDKVYAHGRREVGKFL